MKKTFSSALKKTFFCSAFLAGFAAASTAGQAESVPAGAESSSRASFSVFDENDYWGRWSDKYYTNHTRLALTLESDDRGNIPFFSLGQEMYTPKDRSAPIPDPKDHPYAGYLYVSFGSAFNDNDRTALSQEIQIGATGEWSLADRTQKEYHRLVNEMRPAGWETQIHKRIVGQAIGDLQHRIMIDGECGNGAFASDMIVRGFGSLGNLRCIFSAGTQFRAGWNLPKDFGVQSMRQSASVTFDPKVERSVYGFFDVQADAVFMDKTLTGNNDRDADIYAYPLAAQFSLGICAICDRWMITLYQSFRTKDFSSQDNPFSAYGGVRCSFFF